MDESVDLTNCDREPIHSLGAVQPFGCLLVVSPDWIVTRASTSSASLLGIEAEDLIGRPLDEVFSPEGVHTVRNLATTLRTPNSVGRAFGQELLAGTALYDVAVHLSKGALVVEFEPNGGASEFPSAVRSMVESLDQAESLDAFFKAAARKVRLMTGFDRVMVYRFDETGSGEVVAEARVPTVDSFLGLHYPASDIPAQARILYLRNIFRVIADVAAKPSPIIPQRDESGAPLDLSLSVLRSVSPIHIEYLTNMGVAASLSISIVVRGKLWGLFACHHYSPLLPSFANRTAAELFGTIFSLKLESREHQIQADYEARARSITERLITEGARDPSLLSDASWLSGLMVQCIPANGVAVVLNGQITSSGQTPSPSQISSLIHMLNVQPTREIHHWPCLSNVHEQAIAYADKAAGLMAIPISRRPRDYVLLFRAEQLQSVRWAGQPDKVMQSGPLGDRLTPRKSFEEWSQTVRGCSAPFTPVEVRVAETMKVSLLEVVMKLSDELFEERRRHDERQELLIAELNHRVRNILTLIRALMNQTRATSQDPLDMFEVLDQRVQALARAHNQVTAENWGASRLRDLLTTEFSAFLGAKKDHVSLSGPNIRLEPVAFTTLALTFHELTTNAAKYGALSDSGSVRVAWRLDETEGLVITWEEIGGPAVQAPKRRGFGSTVIEHSVPHELGGTADIRFELTGLRVRFAIPARHAQIDTSEAPQTAQTTAAPPPGMGKTLLEGCEVLLLEDNLMIAMDTEATLDALGAAAVHVASACGPALALIASRSLSLAVLDVNLGGETSLPVAEALGERGIPFLFASGYGEGRVLAERFKDKKTLTKPYEAEELAEAITRMLTKIN